MTERRALLAFMPLLRDPLPGLVLGVWARRADLRLVDALYGACRATFGVAGHHRRTTGEGQRARRARHPLTRWCNAPVIQKPTWTGDARWLYAPPGDLHPIEVREMSVVRRFASVTVMIATVAAVAVVAAPLARANDCVSPYGSLFDGFGSDAPDPAGGTYEGASAFIVNNPTPLPSPLPSPAGVPSPTDLTSWVTYNSGMDRFDPVPVSYTARTSAVAAYETYLATGLYSHAPQYAAPTIQLALYTDYGSGPSAPNGDLILQYVKVPTWVITFKGVPDVGSEGGSLRSEATDSQGTDPGPRVVLQDVLFVVSAETGKGIVLLSTQADPIPQLPPTPDPAAKPAVPSPT